MLGVFVPSTRLQPAGSFQDTLLADVRSSQVAQTPTYDPTEVAMVPLDMLPVPVHPSFIRGHY